MTAQVYIQLMDVKNVLIIPLAALGEPVGGNRYKVALLRNGENVSAKWSLASVTIQTWKWLKVWKRAMR